MKSNPNPSFYPALPYESLSSHMSIGKKIKEKKKKKKNNNQKLKEKKMKRNIDIDLAILPSYDIGFILAWSLAFLQRTPNFSLLIPLCYTEYYPSHIMSMEV